MAVEIRKVSSLKNSVDIDLTNYKLLNKKLFNFVYIYIIDFTFLQTVPLLKYGMDFWNIYLKNSYNYVNLIIILGKNIFV